MKRWNWSLCIFIIIFGGLALSMNDNVNTLISFLKGWIIIVFPIGIIMAFITKD